MATTPLKPSAQIAPVLWLSTDDEAKPYMHQLYGDCSCKSCESKKSTIVLEQ
jgi:hypothetical protein